MNSENVCSFCDKQFKTKINLLTHQKTAKYCLQKQGIKNEQYKCPYCYKSLTTNARLISHINICDVKETKVKKEKNYKDEIAKKEKNYKDEIAKKEKDIVERDKEIEMDKKLINELKFMLEKATQTIAEIAKQPKSVSHNDNRIKTQNNINQSFDINDVTRISDILEHNLTPDVLANGQKGLAEMLKKYLLQNEKGEPIYECTDVSRQKFEFVNKHGFLETDPKAAKLITSLNNANIFDVAHSTGKKLWETDNGVNHDAQTIHMPKVTEVLDIKDDSSKFRSHLASITSR